MSKTHFDHEKLRVYQEAPRFIAFVDPILGELPAKLSARDQLDRAWTSIALNLAKGKGKRSRTDRCRHLAIARGSALECAACLDVLVVRQPLGGDCSAAAQEILAAIVSMLVGLLETFGGQLQEEESLYGVSPLADAKPEHE